MNKRVLIFIPTFDDFSQLPTIIESINALKKPYTLLVIDDGSKPTTAAFRNCLYYRLPDNFGLGVTTHIAVDHALKYQYDILIRLDADGQHSVEDIPRILEPFYADECDLVVGERLNRFEKSDGLSSLRNLTKNYYSWSASKLTQKRAPRDVNSGFFAINKKAMEVITNSFLERYPEPQMYILIAKKRLTIKTILIEQQNRKSGDSTLNLFSAIRMFYRYTLFILGEMLNKQ